MLSRSTPRERDTRKGARTRTGNHQIQNGGTRSRTGETRTRTEDHGVPWNENGTSPERVRTGTCRHENGRRTVQIENGARTEKWENENGEDRERMMTRTGSCTSNPARARSRTEPSQIRAQVSDVQNRARLVTFDVPCKLEWAGLSLACCA